MDSMKTYKVSLARIYLISIKAENEDRAMRFSEYYLGNCPDLSDEKEQILNHFSIEEIEMVYNEANEIVTIME